MNPLLQFDSEEDLPFKPFEGWLNLYSIEFGIVGELKIKLELDQPSG
jgi:hypothetical protein